MAYAPAPGAALRRNCTTVIPGHPSASPGVELIAVGEWCRAQGYDADVYGSGRLINEFEQKIASLLGKPAAVFMPSGTMAQQIALRIWSERAKTPVFGMHPTCHLELHEQQGYAFLHQLKGVQIGPRSAPLAGRHIVELAQTISALIVELPAREIGGQLPVWDELESIKQACRERGIKLCLDGARLWESRAFYENRSYAEICAGFDSVYVSFYKGIGGMAGAILLGDAGFIAEARIWQRRHGGNLVQMLPFVASAAMRFDERLARMPAYFGRAQAFAKAMTGMEQVGVNPDVPQANMLHLHFPVAVAALEAARDHIAAEEKCWLGAPRATDLPGWSALEIYVGENLMALSDDYVVAQYAKLLALARDASIKV
ncbi:MAG TPA: beta-eliminating lyase-related protein [Usitatibacteraceae bacterium]